MLLPFFLYLIVSICFLMTFCFFWKVVEQKRMKSSEFILLSLISLFWLPELGMLTISLILLGPMHYLFHTIRGAFNPT